MPEKGKHKKMQNRKIRNRKKIKAGASSKLKFQKKTCLKD